VPAAKDRSRSTANFLPGINLGAFRTANDLENIEELATMVKSFVTSQAIEELLPTTLSGQPYIRPSHVTLSSSISPLIQSPNPEAIPIKIPLGLISDSQIIEASGRMSTLSPNA